MTCGPRHAVSEQRKRARGNAPWAWSSMARESGSQGLRDLVRPWRDPVWWCSCDPICGDSKQRKKGKKCALFMCSTKCRKGNPGDRRVRCERVLPRTCARLVRACASVGLGLAEQYETEPPITGARSYVSMRRRRRARWPWRGRTSWPRLRTRGSGTGVRCAAWSGSLAPEQQAVWCKVPCRGHGSQPSINHKQRYRVFFMNFPFVRETHYHRYQIRLQHPLHKLGLNARIC